MGFLFGLFPIGVGLLLWWLAYRSVTAARRQRSWATVPGVIQTSSVNTRNVDLPILGNMTVRSTGWSGSTGPQVTYTYEVGGKTYTGSKIGVPPKPRGWRGRRRRASDWDLSQYESGRQVTVHYDPANPSDALLHKMEGVGCAVIALILVGGFFVTVGITALNIVASIS